jgi:DNA-binding SARP family transcriptional activator
MAADPRNGRAPPRSRAVPPVDSQARGRLQASPGSRTLAFRAARGGWAGELEYRVLGPFKVVRGETEIVPPAAARERALLLFLLLQANEIVTAESVIDGVWGDRPPRCAGNALHNCVSHLRKLLEPEACASAPEVLLTRPPGYLLRVGCDQLDSARLETILERGRQAAERGALEQAANLLRKGERLWRGPALADFRFEQFARSEIARLEELRLLTIAERVEVDLALGRHALLVCELTRLVGDHPLNERFRGQLMLALYRCGRQAEALAAYREIRRVLVEELGISPSRPLQILERAILRQEPCLDGPIFGGFIRSVSH